MKGGLAKLTRILVRRLIEAAVIVFLCVLIVDGIIAFTFGHPEILAGNPVSKPLVRFVRQLNLSVARPNPAYDPECSKYDFQVNYVYRDGECRHRSWEYDVTIRGNIMGFPDRDGDVFGPEVIVLGDSFAAGWGVEPEQAFPKLLENKLGVKLLNASGPSYATGRQLVLLDRIMLTNLKTVIIQYANNDAFENAVVWRNEGVRPIHWMTYEAIVKSNVLRKDYIEGPYFPGKYARMIYWMFRQPWIPPLPSDRIRVTNLLGILERSPLVRMEHVDIIILSIYEKDQSDTSFHQRLVRVLEDKRAPQFYNRISAVRTRDFLEAGDYYLLDDHLRPSGHIKIAELLYEELR